MSIFISICGRKNDAKWPNIRETIEYDNFSPVAKWKNRFSTKIKLQYTYQYIYQHCDIISYINKLLHQLPDYLTEHNSLLI